MRRLFLVLIFLIPALAGAVDRYHLVRVLVTGSERYHEDDLVRATEAPTQDLPQNSIQRGRVECVVGE